MPRIKKKIKCTDNNWKNFIKRYQNKICTIIMVSDFNAQIEKQKSLRPIARIYAIHDDGYRLASLIAMAGMVIAGTKFIHKK